MKKIFLSIIGFSISLLAYNGGTFEGNIKGCDEGNAKACKDLAGMYLTGSYPQKVRTDKKKAKLYYAKSTGLYSKYCDEGKGEACFKLAEKYNGMRWGIDQNHTMMLKYYTKSCENNYGRGCNEVGAFYKRGWGIKKDKSKAKEYYRKTIELYEKECNNQIAESCSNLASIYHSKMYDTDNRARGTELEKKAFQLYKELCDKKDDEGCWQMASSYYHGTVVTIDWKKAKEYYGKSCQYGQQSACWKKRDLNVSEQFKYEKKLELRKLWAEYGTKEQMERKKRNDRSQKQQKELNDPNKTMAEKKELLKKMQLENVSWRKESDKRIEAINKAYNDKKKAIEAQLN